MKLLRALAAAAGLLSLLAGCAVSRPPASVDAAAPPRWYAPLPHGGTLADLRQWWRQFEDPVLIRLVTLGHRTLRADAVPIAAISVLQFLWGDL